MSPEPGAAVCRMEEGCITCADRGDVVRVVGPGSAEGLMLCGDAAGRRSEVETALVAPVAAGDALLVHAGVAIARLGRAGGGADEVRR